MKTISKISVLKNKTDFVLFRSLADHKNGSKDSFNFVLHQKSSQISRTNAKREENETYQQHVCFLLPLFTFVLNVVLLLSHSYCFYPKRCDVKYNMKEIVRVRFSFTIYHFPYSIYIVFIVVCVWWTCDAHVICEYAWLAAHFHNRHK